LTVGYRVDTLDPSEEAVELPPGPSVPRPGRADFEDITIENNPSRTVLPEAAPPDEPVIRDELTVFYAGTGDTQVPLPDIQGSEGVYELEIPLSPYTESFTGLYVRNENTHRRITIEEINLTDPSRRGEYIPANPITEASDALLELDGVTVRRPTNTIDDLIEGVTLNLHEPSSRPVELEVRPDTEAVKNSIISFVGHYNQLLTDIQVLTRNEEAIVENLGYLTEEEREAFMEKLGTLQGDITLNQLKNRLQRIMMDPQPAAEEGGIILLAEMGISTDASGPGGGINPNQLRGYLEINEKSLDSVLESRIEEIRSFFGRDANGDLVTDTGLAYTVEQNVTPYTRSGGIISTRLRNIDQQIERTDDNIETVQERLDRKEAELELQYSQMEGALEELQRNSQALDNLNTQQGQ
jgi:flagellar hook-associated protein 2